MMPTGEATAHPSTRASTRALHLLTVGVVAQQGVAVREPGRVEGGVHQVLRGHSAGVVRPTDGTGGRPRRLLHPLAAIRHAILVAAGGGSGVTGKTTH